MERQAEAKTNWRQRVNVNADWSEPSIAVRTIPLAFRTKLSNLHLMLLMASALRDRPRINRTRADQLTGLALFDAMGNPADRAAQSEQAERRAVRQFKKPPQGHQGKIDVRRLAGQLLHGGHQRSGARKTRQDERQQDRRPQV